MSDKAIIAMAISYGLAAFATCGVICCTRLAQANEVKQRHHWSANEAITAAIVWPILLAVVLWDGGTSLVRRWRGHLPKATARDRSK